MSLIFNSKIVKYDEYAPKNVRQVYNDIQRDPYKYLLTPTERAFAFAPIQRAILGFGLGGLWVAYHLRRNNELHRVFSFKLSGDLVFGCYWRLLVGFIIGDRVGARYFLNYRKIWCHKAADHEVRKLTRTWPDAKPFVPIHEQANSYFWA